MCIDIMSKHSCGCLCYQNTHLCPHALGYDEDMPRESMTLDNTMSIPRSAFPAQSKKCRDAGKVRVATRPVSRECPRCKEASRNNGSK